MRALVITALLLGLAWPAEAQTRRPPTEPRAFMSVSGGWQSGATGSETQTTFERYAESGTIGTDYGGSGAGLLDLSAGVRFTRRIGAGAAVTFTATSTDANVVAAVPHPFFLDRHRHVEGTAGGLSRQEAGVHPFVYWDAPARGPWRLRILGGPSYIVVKRDIVEDVDVSETYPYDTALFSRARTRSVSGSGFGAHAAVDVSRMLSRRFAAGAIIRYAFADVSVNTSGGARVSSDGGGLQAGGGLRILLGR